MMHGLELHLCTNGNDWHNFRVLWFYSSPNCCGICGVRFGEVFATGTGNLVGCWRRT